MSGLPPASSALEAEKDIETQQQLKTTQHSESNIPDEKTVVQNDDSRNGLDDEETGSSPGLERWNSSRPNIFRFLACNLGLFIMGMNDACIGVSTQ